MRDSLTVIAIALIAILTAALVGPYLVDWSGQRGWIEARLTQTLGAETKIAGRIDLKLLPSPYFLVETIEVGGGNPARPWRLSAKRLRLEIALAPLLRGDVDLIEARLESPRLELTLAPGGSLPPLRSEEALGRRLRFERIEVADGALRVVDPARNRAFDLTGIDLKAEAASLFGPFKGQGAFDAGGQRTPFRFATGAAEKGEIKLKLSADGRGSLPGVALDGRLSFDGGAQNFAGSAKFESVEPPWRVAGELALDINQARLEAIEAHAGGEDRGLSAKGGAELDFSSDPKASVTLSSDAIDLDAWRAAGGADPRLALARISASPLSLVLSYSAKALTFGGATFTDLGANLVSNGRQSASRERSSDSSSGQAAKRGDRRGAPTWLRFEARGPQKSRLFLDGQWRMGADPDFSGRIQASTEDANWLNSWARPLAPSWPPETLAFRAADLSAHAHLSSKGIELRDLDLRLDSSRFSGTLAYRLGSSAQPARFDANLVTPALNLSALPALGARDLWSRSFGACDGSLWLEALALSFADAPSIGGLNLHLTKTGDKIALDEFTYEGSDGAVATASGLFSNKEAHLDAQVLAPREGKLAAVLARMAQTPAADFMLSRVGSLTPINLSVTADAAQKDTAFAITTLSAKGAIGATSIAATVESDPERAGDMKFSAVAEAKDAAPLLRLLGLPIALSNGLGPAHIDLNAHGPLGQKAQAALTASLGPTSLSFIGEIDPDLARPSAKGSFHFSSPNAAPLLRAGGIAFPDFAAKLPAQFAGDLVLSKAGSRFDDLKGDVAGAAVSGALALGEQNRLTGSIGLDSLSAAALFGLVLGPPEPAKAGSLWPSLAFAPPAFDLPKTSLELTIRNMALPSALFPPGAVAKNARMSVETAPGVLELRNLWLDIAGGAASGEIEVRRAGADASLASRLDFSDIAFDLPAVRGRMSGSIEAAGTGKSAEALAAGLAGSGHAVIASLTIPAADPAALGRVLAAVDKDGQTPGAGEIAAALGRELKRADFKAGSRALDVALAAGTLELSSPASPSADDALKVFFDLRRAILTQHLTFALSAPPKDWSGPPPQIAVLVKGPLSAAPAVDVDAAALANGLAIRAIAQESARIESYEFDIHERAFFYQRLLSERGREQERLGAAAEAAVGGQTAPRPPE